jgi:hypothetical protein
LKETSNLIYLVNNNEKEMFIIISLRKRKKLIETRPTKMFY